MHLITVISLSLILCLLLYQFVTREQVPALKFKSKMDKTHLYEFAKNKIAVDTIRCSGDGKLFVTTSRDRQVMLIACIRDLL